MTNDQSQPTESPPPNGDVQEPVARADDSSDAGAIPYAAGDDSQESGEKDWDNELSVKRIAVELKNIEEEVRSLLIGQDPKRKRRLAGTRRWLELEEDIGGLLHSGRIEESVLKELQLLVSRRHYLFRRLKFLTGTRPTWNS
jgi:hypothetical protein